MISLTLSCEAVSHPVSAKLLLPDSGSKSSLGITETRVKVPDVLQMASDLLSVSATLTLQ